LIDTSYQKQQNQLQNAIADGHNTRTLFEYFSIWHYEYAKNVSVQRHLEDKNYATLLKIVKAWIIFTKKSRESRLFREKVNFLHSHCNKLQTELSIQGDPRIRTNMYYIIVRMKNLQLAKAFDTWRIFSEERSRKRYTNAISIRHLYSKVLSKNMEAWKAYTVSEKNKHKADNFWKRMAQGLAFYL
jgi:hypothetical protein